MLKRTTFLGGSTIALIAAAIVGLARAQDTGQPVGNGAIPGTNGITGATTVFSRVRIVEMDDTIFRLDTETGALSRFRGTESGRNARGSFVSVAPPLRSPTSGFVDIQQAGNATFLVDVVTGQTWILRQRGNSTAAWVEVSTPDDNF